jgi:hypothetical protein
MEDFQEAEKAIGSWQSSTVSIQRLLEYRDPLFIVETKDKAKVKCNPMDPWL